MVSAAVALVLVAGVVYFVDDEAIDISRLTGLPWRYAKIHQRGTLHPYLEVSELDWWDRWRVAWAWIGAKVWVTSVTQ